VSHGTGSVVLDKRSRTWNFLFWENGKRRSKKIGSKTDFPTKTAAWQAAKQLRDALEAQRPVAPAEKTAPTVNTLAKQYREEKMPQRFSTQYGYNQWLVNHILPRWGEGMIIDLQPRPVELWLHSLALSPKSRVHIRGVIQQLWEFAMWRGDIPTQRNPMELVTIKGATKRTRQPRSLTVEEFQAFASKLREPFRTIALLCVLLGLRISECLALKWADVDWLESKLSVERGIVRQRVDDVKTFESRKRLSIDISLIEVLKTSKQTTDFSAPGDWMFASPVQLGALPWSYPQVWKVFQKAAEAAGIGKLGTHTMRHTYRAWLDATGEPIGVQQKLMRHADIRTTMNIYGDAATEDMRRANSKVVQMVLRTGAKAVNGL
jgi:integrase